MSLGEALGLVPIGTIVGIAFVAIVVGVCVGVELVRPWRPPTEARRRQIERFVDDHRIR